MAIYKYDVTEKQAENSKNDEFDPKILRKYQRNITGIKDKVLALYAAGMITRDIAAQIKNLYDVEIWTDMVSNITNKIIPISTE